MKKIEKYFGEDPLVRELTGLKFGCDISPRRLTGLPHFRAPAAPRTAGALHLLLEEFAALKNATPAQVSLAWMLHKRDFIVPIPGMRKEARILENLGAADVELSDSEFEKIETELAKIKIYGNRTDEDIAKLGTIRAK